MKIDFYDMNDKLLFVFDVSENLPAWTMLELAKSLLGKQIWFEIGGPRYTVAYVKSPMFGNIRIYKMLDDPTRPSGSSKESERD